MNGLVVVLVMKRMDWFERTKRGRERKEKREG